MQEGMAVEKAENPVASYSSCSLHPQTGLRRVFPRSGFSPPPPHQTTPKSAQARRKKIHPSLSIKRPVRYCSPPVHSFRWGRSRSSSSRNDACCRRHHCSVLTFHSAEDRRPNRHCHIPHMCVHSSYCSYRGYSSLCSAALVRNLWRNPIADVAGALSVCHYPGAGCRGRM